MNILPSLFGGPKPSLQPSGPSQFPQPDERDRRALFWWLKRNTSYTAIARNGELWSQFVAEYESWLRSQDDPYEHYVEAFKYALDTQISYRRGLERLRRGDRSAFNCASSEGLLGRLYTGSVGRRLEWNPPVEAIAAEDRLPESMLRAYFKAHESAMACARTTSYRGMGFPVGSARTLLAALPFDTALPEPRWDISFAPGKRAPKDGIYEMVNLDGHIVGSLQHFIKGEEARPDDFVEFGPDAGNEHAKSFFWRLLWEDTRYKDGTLPEEEGSYPTPEQSVAAARPAPEPRRIRCEGGEPCPQGGWWFTPAKADSRRHFQEGELMPNFQSDYGKTIWQWD